MESNGELQSGRNIQQVLINYEWDRAAIDWEMNPLPEIGEGEHCVDNLLLLLLLLLLLTSSSSYILCRVFILIFVRQNMYLGYYYYYYYYYYYHYSVWMSIVNGILCMVLHLNQRSTLKPIRDGEYSVDKLTLLLLLLLLLLLNYSNSAVRSYKLLTLKFVKSQWTQFLSQNWNIEGNWKLLNIHT